MQSSPHLLPPLVVAHVAGGVEQQPVGAGQRSDVTELDTGGPIGERIGLLLLFSFVLSLNDLPGTVTVTENVLFSLQIAVVMFVFRTDSPPVCRPTAALLAGIEIISWIAVLTEHSIPQPQPGDGQLRTCRKQHCTHSQSHQCTVPRAHWLGL